MPYFEARASAIAGRGRTEPGCVVDSDLAKLQPAESPATLASLAADEPVGSIAPGGTVTGNVDFAGDADYFNISLVAGQTYSIALTGSGGTPLADAFLTLTNSGGTVVANDDDGGRGVNALLTFTATTSGTYQIVAEAYPGAGLTGGYTLDVRQMGADSVGSTIGTATTITAGSTTFGFIEASNDVDMYAVTLVAGEYYTFDLAGGADYDTNVNSVPRGELDTRITIYDAAGNQVAFNDDNSYPDDVSSGLSFIASASGTYYVQVDAYRRQTGGYTLDVEHIDLSALDPLDSIDWGSQLASNVVTVYFAAAGETFDGVTSLGWSQYEIDQAMEALQTYADVSTLSFSITTNAATATFRLVTTQSNEFLGYFNPPGETNAGVGVFANNGSGWNTTGGLEPGGYGFITLVHEFGHGLGLAHPHDDGGTSTIMPGVTAPFDSFGVYDLNQGVYTTMSYNDGWQLHPSGANSGSLNFGYQAGPSALDIALIQQNYGADSHNAGDTVYTLPTANAAGTFWDVIWDSGGTDTIAHAGTVAARIDLTAATLDYTATGAGVISFVNGVYGGFTIAGGVVIENATGGSGGDVLIGNSAANLLTGGGGADTMEGRDGNDTLAGGLGADLLSGGPGSDTFAFNFGDGLDTVTDLAAGDTVRVTGYSAAQSITQSGANVIVVLSASDQITFHNTTVATVQAALRFPAGSTIEGTPGDDTLVGTTADDTINGYAGNDTLDGLAGADTMTGGTGNDKYYVNDLNDVVVEAAGEGEDRVLCRVSYTLAAGVSVEILGVANQLNTTALNLTGNEFRQLMVGNAGNNILDGRGGNDDLAGGSGTDTLIGGTGNDVFRVNDASDVVVEFAGEGEDMVRASSSYTLAAGASVETLTTRNSNSSQAIDLGGNELNNAIYGTAGVNVLDGGGGHDRLFGFAGNDTLIGGAGIDQLTGGAGSDRFVFGAAADSAVATPDRILDLGSGDLIDLSGIDANSVLGGDQAFNFIGSAAFSNTAGELRTAVVSGNTMIYGDTNGDGAADFAINVTGTPALTLDYFVL